MRIMKAQENAAQGLNTSFVIASVGSSVTAGITLTLTRIPNPNPTLTLTLTLGHDGFGPTAYPGIISRWFGPMLEHAGITLEVPHITHRTSSI